MNLRSMAVAGATMLAVVLVADETPSPAPEVPYPEGYRQWMHLASGVTLPPRESAPHDAVGEIDHAPRGLIHHIYANEAALEGYRTGHFPEGAVLVADWFFLEARGAGLGQGSRKSINVMYRDARYADTGGWGFEDFDRDSRTMRNVGTNARQMCFECHTKASERGHVFSVLKP